MNHIYSESLLYDLAFSYRDYPQESATLASWFQHFRARPPKSALELACGPARHLHELAPSCRATGIDLSASMCEYANHIAHEAQHNIGFHQLDMATFRLDERFDMALLLINSVNHLQTTQQLNNMFSRVEEHLEPGGLFIIEASMKEPFVPGSSQWTQENENNSVAIKWSWTQNADEVELTGDVGGRKVAVQHTFPMRYWVMQEIVDAANLCNLRLLGSSGDDDLNNDQLIGRVHHLDNPTSMHRCLVFGREVDDK